MGGSVNPYGTPIAIPLALPVAHSATPVGQHAVRPQAAVPTGPQGQHAFTPQGQAFYQQRLKEIEAAKQLLSDLLTPQLVVRCLTCGEQFLCISWAEYIKLCDGDYFTPKWRWYNKVALHYCQYPEHNIASNRHPTGLVGGYNFSEQFKIQLANAGITVYDLIHVVREMEIKVKDAPI